MIYESLKNILLNKLKFEPKIPKLSYLARLYEQKFVILYFSYLNYRYTVYGLWFTVYGLNQTKILKVRFTVWFGLEFFKTRPQTANHKPDQISKFRFGLV